MGISALAFSLPDIPLPKLHGAKDFVWMIGGTLPSAPHDSAFK
jgi:hypothetical protein